MQVPSQVPWNVVFIGANSFALSMTVFEKIDVEFRVRVTASFKFHAVVALLW